MGGRRARRTTQKRRLEDLTPDELMARVLRCPVAEVRDAEQRFDAGRQYAEALPPRDLDRLVGRSLDVDDQPTALAAALVAMQRGEGAALATYGIRRPDALEPLERWSGLVYGEVA